MVFLPLVRHDDMQRSVALCQELLRLLDCIDSGRSRNRGWVLKQARTLPVLQIIAAVAVQ